jgi:phenylacetyl-CoA:acceptor oxidoreductase
MWICYRTNPAISSWNAPEVAERVAEFPFTVAFAYTDDETNHMADILLPEATDLEATQLIRVGGTKTVQQYWTHEGWAIRQPVADPIADVMDMTDIATELAQRVGILEDYNAAINTGSAGQRLKNDDFDYAIDVTKAHPKDVIWDATCRAASHAMSNGEEVHGLDWFKENGYMLGDFPQIQWYMQPYVKDQNLRWELPYQERIKRHGAQLANRMHEAGIDWWEKQLEEYEALPSWEPFPEIWIDHAREVGKNPDDYQFWALTARSMQYSWGANVGIPLINEVANNVAGHSGVIINRDVAHDLGIEDGDHVIIESPTGVTEGHAMLRAGIRPDTLLMIGQFDHWKTPFAKDLKLPSLNSLTALSLSLTDSTGSGSDLTRVKVTRGTGAKREVA